MVKSWAMIGVQTGAPTAGDFPSLPPAPSGSPRRRARVCIATRDIVGPIRNGGIGTAYTALAETLADAGHEVTIAYVLGRHSETHSIETHIERYRARRIRFVPVPALPFPIYAEPAAIDSYQTYLWLKRQDFDVIHFHEWMAPGFHSIVAKHQGLAFENTLLVVGAHSPSLWHKRNNLQLVEAVGELNVDYMERQSVEWADLVVSPSQYLLKWMQAEGWTLPARAYVQPNILPAAARAEPLSRAPRLVDELVFFGRLESRKGLTLFCDAVDRLVARGRAPRVTFLGKSGTVDGRDGAVYVERRARDWPTAPALVTDQDHQGALDYLRGGARLAVIASLVENSPYTVLECLGAGLPFVASDTGGIPELVGESDRPLVLFAPRADRLAEKLAHALDHGAPIARPAVGFSTVEERWRDWHAGPAPTPPPAARITGEPLPLVSVCIPHHDRPALLRQAIHSLTRQDYPLFEVLVVDDGSATAEAQATLAALEPDFAARGWRILRQENRFAGAARNTAARHARGPWLLFMDDDNYARPHELSTLVRVAERSGADVLTCFSDVWSGDDAPGDELLPRHRQLFLGGPLSAGVLYNCFGDVNALVRKSSFDAVGGFTEDFGVGHEDWELFARLALAGARLECVPEPLFWYRASAAGISGTTPSQANYERSLRPYREAVPRSLWPLLDLAQGLHRAATPRHLEAIQNPEIQRILIYLTDLKVRHPRLVSVMREALKKAVGLAGRLQR